MKYEYKVHVVSCYDCSGMDELEQHLNDGWTIERADHNGNNSILVYILKRVRKEEK